MGWYANLKIGKKMLLGFSAIIFISSVMGIASLRGLGKINDMLGLINNTIMLQIVYSNDLNTYVANHNRQVLRHILASNQEVMQQIKSQIQLNELAISDLLDKYRTTGMDITKQRLLERFTRCLPDYMTIAGQIARFSAEGKKQDALRIAEGEGQQKFRELEYAISELVRYNVAEGKQHGVQANEVYHNLRYALASLMVVSLLLAFAIVWRITRSVARPVGQALRTLRLLSDGAVEKARLVEAVASGDLERQIRITDPLKLDKTMLTKDEAGELLKTVADISVTQAAADMALARMTEALREVRDTGKAVDWLKSAIGGINLLLMRSDLTLQDMVEQSLNFICDYLGAPVGAFYLWNERESILELAAGNRLPNQEGRLRRFHLGEGIAGRAASDMKAVLVSDVPPGYLTLSSALGGAEPLNIAAMPLIHDNRLVGVIEIGVFKTFDSHESELLEQLCGVLSNGVGVNISRRMVDELLEQTQAQAEELREKQEELQQSNEELHERAEMLEQQREQIHANNRELEESSREIQRKADELERVSTYKSEFLANMSHELRTPLNSLMILSGLLKNNQEGNLTDKQVEFAATINRSGKDLLSMINDILDISKIESGHIEHSYEELKLSEICEQLETTFQSVAADKGIGFAVTLDETAPAAFTGDRQSIQQILKNLISNACKFTSQGSVTMHVYTPANSENPLKSRSTAFAVTDTGIGVPPEKRTIIFKAFMQADGSTRRTHGGTGLGLSISQQLARSMGGDIFLISETGKGSTFTLYLPVAQTGQAEINGIGYMETSPVPDRQRVITPAPVEDALLKGKRVLIVDDDMRNIFSLTRALEEKKIFVFEAENGCEALMQLDKHPGIDLVLMDIMMPEMDGYEAMCHIRKDTRFRDLPIIALTAKAMKGDRDECLKAGASDYISKPLDMEKLFSMLRVWLYSATEENGE